MRAAELQQMGALLPAGSNSSLSTKVPCGRATRIRPQATRGLLRQRSIKAVIEPPVLPFEKDAEHLSQWRPESWRQLKAHQQPNYQDQEKLRDAVETITRMPPLVFAGECRNLQSRLAKCAAGEAFLLQGEHFLLGLCAVCDCGTAEQCKSVRVLQCGCQQSCGYSEQQACISALILVMGIFSLRKGTCMLQGETALRAFRNSAPIGSETLSESCCRWPWLPCSGVVCLS